MARVALQDPLVDRQVGRLVEAQDKPFGQVVYVRGFLLIYAV
jgi:hypothetical protein